MGPSQRFGLLLLSYILAAAALDVLPDIIAADDECQTAEGGAGSCALNALQVKGKAIVEAEVEVEKATVRADTFPDLTTGFDVPGPYLEEPSAEEADNPRQAKEGWENETSLHQASSNTWGGSFCEAHHTGYFCDQTTRVKCCHNSGGYVKCGTTLKSSHCAPGGGGLVEFYPESYYDSRRRYGGGSDFDSRRRYGGDSYFDSRRRYGGSSYFDSRRRYGGGSYFDSRRRYGGGSYYDSRRRYGGGGWHIHQGWHVSSFCQSHHTGYFCTSHTKVHCCNDYGHYVDCTTRTSTMNRC